MVHIITGGNIPKRVTPMRVKSFGAGALTRIFNRGSSYEFRFSQAVGVPFTVNAPAGTVTGDFLHCLVAPFVSAPTGWTLTDTLTAFRVFTRVADGTATDNFIVTPLATGEHMAMNTSFGRNPDSGTFNISGTPARQQDSGAGVGPWVMPANPNDLGVAESMSVAMYSAFFNNAATPTIDSSGRPANFTLGDDRAENGALRVRYLGFSFAFEDPSVSDAGYNILYTPASSAGGGGSLKYGSRQHRLFLT